MQQQFAIVFDAKELMELERILIDRDPEGATSNHRSNSPWETQEPRCRGKEARAK